MTNSGTGNGISGRSENGGAGVWGTSPNGNGVVGTSGSGLGLYAESGTGQAAFFKSGGTGTTSGFRAVEIHSYNSGANSSALWVEYHGAIPPNGARAYAATFNGNVLVYYDFIGGGNKSFRIDHPLDPANQTFTHACIESNEVKNLYDGTVITDASGDATVTLPSYFEALNKNFRYQLTCVGQFAQAIVPSKVKNNQFTIKTDRPMMSGN